MSCTSVATMSLATMAVLAEAAVWPPALKRVDAELVDMTLTWHVARRGERRRRPLPPENHDSAQAEGPDATKAIFQEEEQ